MGQKQARWPGEGTLQAESQPHWCPQECGDSGHAHEPERTEEQCGPEMFAFGPNSTGLYLCFKYSVL